MVEPALGVCFQMSCAKGEWPRFDLRFSSVSFIKSPDEASENRMLAFSELRLHDGNPIVSRGECPEMEHLTFFHNFSLITGTTINEPH